VSEYKLSRQALFNRLIERQLSKEDVKNLIDWLSNDDLDAEASALILSHLKNEISGEQLDPEIFAVLKSKLPLILEKQESGAKRRFMFLRSGWVRYAAAIIIFLGVGAYFLLFNNSAQKQSETGEVVTNSQPDVQPGKEGAILTLDDGSTVILDNLDDGLITTQNGVNVLLNDGQLTYAIGNIVDKKEIAYNTMSTPKGRQFQLLLPDGSKVWLNAASSIRYPTVFTGTERKVDITGEVYFEVSANAKMPFRVKVNGETEIEVIGTHFNINAYTNEGNIRTTLLEGSIRISDHGEKVILKPGQQAQSGQASQLIKIFNDVNIERVMAWKNGVFNFQDATLEEVMRQLERWYDIDVVYEKGVPKLEFFGKMGRDLTLMEVLRGLQMSEVRCRIEDGRKLVVMP